MGHYVNETYLILLLKKICSVSDIPKSTLVNLYSFFPKSCLYCVIVTLNLYIQSKNGILRMSEKNYYLYKKNYGMEKKTFKNKHVGIFPSLCEFVLKNIKCITYHTSHSWMLTFQNGILRLF